jgi:hypothetical protein
VVAMAPERTIFTAASKCEMITSAKI